MSSRSIQIEAGKADNASTLMREIERYLAAVALYRELGCQPTWIREWLPSEPPTTGRALIG